MSSPFGPERNSSSGIPGILIPYRWTPQLFPRSGPAYPWRRCTRCRNPSDRSWSHLPSCRTEDPLPEPPARSRLPRPRRSALPAGLKPLSRGGSGWCSHRWLHRSGSWSQARSALQGALRAASCCLNRARRWSHRWSWSAGRVPRYPGAAADPAATFRSTRWARGPGHIMPRSVRRNPRPSRRYLPR